MTRSPAVPMTPPTGLRATVRFDEPFGYLAVHRPTGLFPIAGWVATLEAAP
ncbi:hypothetical protein ACPPVO_50830 [Dactylosporangium sp. McL0621]|uniref:hypothetical protein n=1 Tax=Dactylosporangium sp. McL0621 TaxID=3415678 RepID=UPI003CF9CCA5